MDLQRREEYKQKLFELTPADGKTNRERCSTKQEKLKSAVPTDDFGQDDYWDLRNSLIADGKLEKGRGHGGSVRRVPSAAEPAPWLSSVPPTAISEASLYEPFQTAILKGRTLLLGKACSGHM